MLCSSVNIGSLREAFFISALYYHYVRYAKKGDYTVDDKYTFEIGGKNKDLKQLSDYPDSFLVPDNIEIGDDKKLPLWTFGFLY